MLGAKPKAEAEELLGPLTGVVNCAGIAADHHGFDTPPELFRRILREFITRFEFALPGTVDRLRERTERDDEAPVILAATDPAELDAPQAEVSTDASCPR